MTHENYCGEKKILVPDRTSLNITLSVWKALILRESLQRLFGSRAAWMWLLFEPVIHVVFIMFIMAVVRMRVIEGIDTSIWLMAGLLSFFMFQRTATQAMGAVRTNHQLFSYRQVKPVDTVLARAFLEGFLTIVVAVILFIGAGLFGLDVVPADPLSVFQAFIGLWLIGLGFGLITSVADVLLPELGKIIKILLRPVYLFSGVIFPLDKVPLPYREWLMYNPIAHGLEAARLGFAPYYKASPELSISYIFEVALICIFIGLALQVHYSLKMVTK